jgi:hypothetical protein
MPLRLVPCFVAFSLIVMIATATAAVATSTAFTPSLCEAMLPHRLQSADSNVVPTPPSSNAAAVPATMQLRRRRNHASDHVTLRAAIPPSDPERNRARQAALLVALLGALGLLLDYTPTAIDLFRAPITESMMDVRGFDLRGPRYVAATRSPFLLPLQRTVPLPADVQTLVSDSGDAVRAMQRQIYKRMRVRRAAAQAAAAADRVNSQAKQTRQAPGNNPAWVQQHWCVPKK